MLSVEELTKNIVVNCLAVSGIVESLIRNIGGYDDNYPDLAQNIYIDLLSKDDDKIVEMFKNGQIKFFLVRMITNNIYSVNSPWYVTYKKHKNNTINIDDIKDKM